MYMYIFVTRIYVFPLINGRSRECIQAYLDKRELISGLADVGALPLPYIQYYIALVIVVVCQTSKVPHLLVVSHPLLEKVRAHLRRILYIYIPSRLLGAYNSTLSSHSVAKENED